MNASHPDLSKSVLCRRCGTALRAVAFLDLEKDAQGGEFDVYCGPCSKLLEREALRSWATKWAKGIADEEHHENFFKILAAAWEQGFAKARTFEEARPVFDVSDNPFIAESALIDPLIQIQENRQVDSSNPPTPMQEDYDKIYEPAPSPYSETGQ